MNTHIVDMTATTTGAVDLTLELRSANGSSTEFYQADEERVCETLRLLAAPQLFAQPHVLLTWQHCTSMIPCRGIDMILARTSARTPLKFPLHLPQGLFDLVLQPEAWPESEPDAIEDQDKQEHGQPRRRDSQVEIHTLGGWTVNLKTAALIHRNVQDEPQWFSRLPEVPTIPFRLPEGGFGLINTANITMATASPKPDALPGSPLPLILRRHSPRQS